MKMYRFALMIILLMSFCFVFGSTAGVAALFVDTKVVSGEIQSIDDGIIMLRGKGKYYPSSSIDSIDFEKGNLVSIRYVVNSEQTNIFVEIKPGLHSLQQNDPERKSSQGKDMY